MLQAIGHLDRSLARANAIGNDRSRVVSGRSGAIARWVAEIFKRTQVHFRWTRSRLDHWVGRQLPLETVVLRQAILPDV